MTLRDEIERALKAQTRWPQYHALRNTGLVWEWEDQVVTAEAYATQVLLNGHSEKQAAHDGARIVLREMVQDAGLVQVRENGRRVWRKPDHSMGDMGLDAGFADPADIDRAMREAEMEAKADELRQIFAQAAEGISLMEELPEGIDTLTIMYMVSENGVRETARRLNVNRDRLKKRWETFQRRVARQVSAS